MHMYIYISDIGAFHEKRIHMCDFRRNYHHLRYTLRAFTFDFLLTGKESFLANHSVTCLCYLCVRVSGESIRTRTKDCELFEFRSLPMYARFCLDSNFLSPGSAVVCVQCLLLHVFRNRECV